MNNGLTYCIGIFLTGFGASFAAHTLGATPQHSFLFGVAFVTGVLGIALVAYALKRRSDGH